jgi:hypothetical protein
MNGVMPLNLRLQKSDQTDFNTSSNTIDEIKYSVIGTGHLPMGNGTFEPANFHFWNRGK